jgi:predicted amidohydrolase
LFFTPELVICYAEFFRMKIAVAQIQSVRGDVAQNLRRHKALIEHAAQSGAQALFFPELSLTSYAPPLAEHLAADVDDEQFNELQQLGDQYDILIGAGMPTRSASGIHITMLLFQPHVPRKAYSKQYLHADELPYFVPGNTPGLIQVNGITIALAICYEISIPAHAAAAGNSGAQVYVASVAKTVSGVEKAIVQLSETAAKYGMYVMMANAIGPCDDGICGGRSSIWNKEGKLIGQLADMEEGVLMVEV